MKFKDEESGQILLITAFCMVSLMGFLALAVDVGVLYHTRWQMQIAADAAATAAAVEYLHNVQADGSYDQAAAITAGTNAAAANNLNDGNTMTATVNINTNANSPASHKGCSGSTCFFEAVVSKPNPTIFYRAFFALWRGGDGGAFTVAARAVAGTPGNATGCMFLTNSSGSVFQANGNYQINATGCGLYVNSTSSSAMTGNGAKGRVSVASVSAVGSTSGYTANFPSSTVLSGGVIPQTIPFNNIVPPTPTGCVAPSGGKLTGTASPGCYSGNVNIGTVTLSAGTYIFTGDVTINGAVTGHNVAFDITTGSFSVKPGNSTMDLTAPTSGIFNGVSIYMPSGNNSTISLQAGSATGSLSGFIVAPAATFTMQDHGGSMTIGGLIVNNIDNGPAVLNLSGYNPSTSPLKVVTLVE
jgi:Putative Flp pilus-assembly TadE/G-like